MSACQMLVVLFALVNQGYSRVKKLEGPIFVGQFFLLEIEGPPTSISLSGSKMGRGGRWVTTSLLTVPTVMCNI